MKTVAYNLVLAFIFATQALSLAGCAQHVKVYECKADCNNNTLECRTAISSSELDLD